MYMYCNEFIHLGLIDLDYIQCPFCYEQIQTFNRLKYTCCDNMKIINDYLWSICKGHTCLLCERCGSVHGYETAKEYIDFYEKRYRIRRKSIYNRKYHLQNKIFNLRRIHNVDMSFKQNKQILDIFTKIDIVLPIVNNNTRKRLIKIDFILNKLFSLLNINIQIPQKGLKHTLLYNENYWNKINSLIGEEIQSILDR